MKYFEIKDKYILPYMYYDWIFRPKKGFIVWREGTGNNIELLHIKTFQRRKGYGRELVVDMVKYLNEYHKPYYSVFGFILPDNMRGMDFYAGIGFQLVETGHIYEAGNAVMFWQEFNKLKEKMGV